MRQLPPPLVVASVPVQVQARFGREDADSVAIEGHAPEVEDELLTVHGGYSFAVGRGDVLLYERSPVG